jgi:hypothetical protein
MLSNESSFDFAKDEIDDTELFKKFTEEDIANRRKEELEKKYD